MRQHWTSLDELRKDYGLDPFVRRTKDAKKLEKQQDRFLRKHKCSACGEPMSFVGGNIMACTNDSCKGIKIEHKDRDGNSIISYAISYDLLDDIGSDIAKNIL